MFTILLLTEGAGPYGFCANIANEPKIRQAWHKQKNPPIPKVFEEGYGEKAFFKKFLPEKIKKRKKR